MVKDLPATLWIDTSRWPVLHYTGPVTVSDQEMEEVMAESRMLRGLGRTHGLVLDVRKTKGLTPSQRRMITVGMAETETTVKATCVGLALIFDSTVLRGVLTAIFWVKPAVIPTRVFKTPEEGDAWLRAEVNAREGASASA